MLQSLAQSTCGKPNIPGTKTKLRITCSCDLPDGMPLTRKEVVLAAAGTPAQGDSKIYDEPFNFANAPAGEGYWREYDILVDTGSLNAALEGEVGGQGFMSQIPFFVIGMDAAQLEFADEVVAHSSCMIVSIESRDGTAYVIGRHDNPVIVESADLSLGQKNGDRKGGAYVLKSSEGFAPMIYDAATHGFDITPN